MPKVITPPQVIHQHITTKTSQGEVTINLNLTITINADGTFQVGANASEHAPVVKPKVEEKEVPDSIFTIPEFESTETLLDFGQDTGGR
jgi:hypothetical protein